MSDRAFGLAETGAQREPIEAVGVMGAPLFGRRRNPPLAIKPGTLAGERSGFVLARNRRSIGCRPSKREPTVLR